MRTNRLGPMIMGLGIVFIGAAIILVYYYQKAGGRLPFASERYEFKVTVSEPQQLLKHADVRAAGVKVGEVNQIDNDIRKEGTFAILELALDKEKLDTVYGNAQFAVRQKTLVGENYVSIEDPGTPQAGAVKQGQLLGLRNNQEVAPLDDILGMVDAPTRRRISANFQALGEGFEGNATSFNQALQALQPLFNDGGRTLATLDAQKQQVARLIQSTGVVTKAIADRGRDAQELVREINKAAISYDRRADAATAMFEELPSTLAQARGTVTKLANFSGRATPVMSDLRVGLKTLNKPIRDLQPTANQARTLFKELKPTLDVAEPAVRQLRPFANAGVPAIGSFDALMRQMNPFFRYLSPYNRDISSLLANFSTGLQDKVFFGQLGRCACPFNIDTVGAFLPSESQQKALYSLISGLNGDGKVFDYGYNPYRAPNTLSDQSGNFSGSYTRLQQDNK